MEPSTSGIDMEPAAYTAGEQFQRERRTLFAEGWLVFAASAQLPAPGDFVGHSIGGWPLFAIRGDDGVARAFHNVCRHQSMPVVEQPAGSCAMLRCRYHGWTYGLDGQFREAPPRVGPSDPPDQLDLNAIHLVEQGNLCLVRVRPGGDPAPRLALPGRFATALATDIDANWKAAIEPFLADQNRRFIWPLALIAEAEPGLAVLRQIVPRSFSRTRMIDLIFTADGAISDEIVAAQQAHAAAEKTVAESCQAAHAAGTAAPPSRAAAEFLREVAAACAE